MLTYKDDAHPGHRAGLAPARPGADRDEAIRTARKNRTAALLVPAVSVQDLYAVVKSGELMPQKSTYFYPKVITGVVYRSLE